MKDKSLIRSQFLIGLTIASVGCQSLPDVSPFATVTTELAAAVRASGKAVESEIRRMENGDALADQLSGDWQTRLQVMSATVHYADSLVAIVSATQESGDVAKRLADKVGALAQAAGFTPPAAGMAVVSDTAGFIWTQIALARGAKSLERALEAARPAVDRIAAEIAEDLASLDQAVQGAAQHQEGAVVADETFRSARDAETAALAAKKKVLDQIKTTTDPVALVGMSAQLAQLQEIEHVLTATSATLTPKRGLIDEARRRERMARELIATTSDALRRWAVGHKDLVFAVRNRRPLDVDSVAEAVVDIRNLIRRASEL